MESNIKNHDKGVITYTVDNSWVNDTNKGWGNGYIAIPWNHSYALNVKESWKGKDEHAHIWVNNNYPSQEVEFTYSEQQIMNGKRYLVLGFHTLNSWNTLENTPEKKVVALIEDYVPVVNSIK